MEEHEGDGEAWRSLFEAEECLLNYAAARHCLEQAMNRSGRRDKKDLKRLALLEECLSEWSKLSLTPSQLEILGTHLRGRLREEVCDHTIRFTREWLQSASIEKPNAVIDALRNRGGFCDCEVLHNVVEG